MPNLHYKSLSIVSSVIALLIVLPVFAEASDYTDIFIYNFDVSDDADTVTFDLSRRIPKSEQFVVPVAFIKDGQHLGTSQSPMAGGKHVTLSGLREVFDQNGYGTYALYVRACPADIPYEGSGKGSGCGPTAGVKVEHYPWKLSSQHAEDDARIFVTSGQQITFKATAQGSSTKTPSLSLLDAFGRPSDVLRCEEKKFVGRAEWICTVESEDETIVVATVKNGDEQMSNAMAISVFEENRLDAARFEGLCGIRLIKQEGNRFTYEVSRENTHERDALCGGARFFVHEPARIISQSTYEFTVDAPPTESFPIFAEKGDGSGPRILHSENTFDVTLILQSALCQTLVLQDAQTFTLLRRNNEGIEVSSCFFPDAAIVPLKGNARIISQERNRIVLDATTSSSFELQTSGRAYREDYDSFPSPRVGGDETSDEERMFYQALFPNRGEKYEIVAVNGVATSTVHSEGGFPDVSTSHPNAQAINYVREHGIVDGFPDGTYKPNATINRAEFTKIIVSAVFDKERIEKCGSTYFKDGVLGQWYNIYVCTAKDEGLIDGYPDGTFRPANPITFVEAAKIITQAFRLPTESYEEDIWHKPFTDVLAEKRTIPTSISRMDQQITRGEMAEMVYRLHTGDTQKSTTDYQKLLEDSGVLAQRELEMTKYEWRGEEVPLDILRFKNLETLILNNISIAEIPDELGQLTKLQHLIVFTNNLAKTPASLTKWTNLRTLALEGNGYGSKLTALPDDIGNLKNLEVLRLHYNSIANLPKSIGQLTKLKELDLKQNALTSLPPEIGNLTALEELNVERNPISDWPDEMANLKNLRLLYAPHDTSDAMRAKFEQWFPNAKLYYYR